MTAAERACLEAAAAVVAASGEPCLLCGGPASGAGVFIPHDAGFRLLVAAPTAGRRCLVYPLCDDCAASERYATEQGETAIVVAFAADLARGEVAQ